MRVFSLSKRCCLDLNSSGILLGTEPVLVHLVCILYCRCFHMFCNVWVCVCVGFVMSGCFGNMCTYTVFCIVCTMLLIVYVYLFLFVLSVLE